MNFREKLNEAAEDNIPAHAPDALYDEGFIDGFTACADWLMQQPLSERLTDAEKEKIREAYRDYNQIMALPSGRAVCNVLTAIFTPDLFKNK